MSHARDVVQFARTAQAAAASGLLGLIQTERLLPGTTGLVTVT
jgi:hypothetical protein